jgi:hypothetical protein
VHFLGPAPGKTAHIKRCSAVQSDRNLYKRLWDKVHENCNTCRYNYLWIPYQDPFHRPGIIDPKLSGSRPRSRIDVPEMYTPCRTSFLWMAILDPRSSRPKFLATMGLPLCATAESARPCP